MMIWSAGSCSALSSSKALPEWAEISWAAEMKRRKQIETGAGWFEVREKPEPLLGKGKRQSEAE